MYRIEQIGGRVEVLVSDRHTFGTDSLLLSDFAAPRRKDIACDLGSGCGIIPLLWFREPETAPREAWSVDIQPEATEQVTQSIARSGLQDKLHPLNADLRKLKGKLSAGGFTLVTCNPPYFRVGSGQLSETDSDRIARHETKCTPDDFCATAAYLLGWGGRLCVCHLPERLTDVLYAMRTHDIEPKRLRFVQQTAEDAPWLLLCEGKRGAKPGLQVCAPLMMRKNGQPSAEMQRIHRLYGKL